MYVIPVLSKALDVLELMQKENTPRTLEEIFQRTNISKTTVYRILKTLVHRGYLAHSENGLYRLVSRPRKLRFGFGGESSEMPFSEGVRESLQAAANSAGVDLLVLDNHYDAQIAVRNAEEFVRQQVDLVIEFQIDQRIAPAIADKISGAGIPLIAVDIPHPHATYLGVDNYRVGFGRGGAAGSESHHRCIRGDSLATTWPEGQHLPVGGRSGLTREKQPAGSKLSSSPFE